MQTVYRNGSRLEYADSLQKTGSGCGVDWSMQTVYRRGGVEWSGLEYADCLQKSGSGVEWTGLEYADCLQKSGSGSGVEWTGLEYADCFRRVVVLVVWSGLEYADCFRRVVVLVERNKQNVYRRMVVVVVVVVVVEWIMQTVYRRVVGVVGLSIQNICEADFGDRRRMCSVRLALKVTCLSSFEVLVQTNVMSIPDPFTFKAYRSITVFRI
jgi:hypothetical protein